MSQNFKLSHCLLFIFQEIIGLSEFLERAKKDPPSSAELSPKAFSSLDKLCFYCDLLLQASKIPEGAVVAMIEDIHCSVLQLKTRLTLLKKPLEAKFLKTLQQKLAALFSALLPHLQEVKMDENVLIYLIEQKKKWNALLGNQAIEQLLNRFFPEGRSQLRSLLSEGFTRRGFASFFAEKEPLLDAIQWDSSCAPPPSQV